MRKALKLELTLSAIVEVSPAIVAPTILTAERSAATLKEIKKKTLENFKIKLGNKDYMSQLRVEVLDIPEIPRVF